MLQHALPTDMVVRRKGIQLVSKCSCCVISSSFETSTHLLISSEVATQVWAMVCRLTNMPFGFSSLSQLLSTWWNTEGIGDVHQWLCKIVPGPTLWMIWKARNEDRFKGKLMHCKEIICKIQRYINDLFIAQKIKLPKGTISLECMEFSRLSECHKPMEVKLVTWQRPRIHWVKLNVDGACKGIPGRLGGCMVVFLKKIHGNIVLAFYV